jgi:hypothetical protein
MSSCRAFRKRIPEALFGEMAGRRREKFERHRSECSSCAAEYAEALRASYLAGRRSRPDPGQAFWDGYWDRLQARRAEEAPLEAERSAPAPVPVRPSPAFPRWLAVPAAAAAILVAGIFLGRYAFKSGSRTVPAPPGGTSQAIPAAQADLGARTSRYLDRSKRILLAIVNYQPGTQDPYGLDLPGQREASRELVAEAAFLKNDLGLAKDRRLENLVGDLERILLQIANLESEDDLAAVSIIKAGAESRDILFEINLTELRRPLAAGPSPKTPASASRGGVSSM